MIGDAGQHVAEIRFGIEVVEFGGADQAVDGCGALAYILAYGRRGRSKWKFQLTRVVIARSVALA